MKRIWAVLLCLVVLGGLPVKAKAAPLMDLENKTSINLQHGRTFAKIDIPEEVDRLRKMFKAHAYEKAKPSDAVGWEYSMAWFSDESPEAETIIVKSSTCIEYNGDLYTLTDGGLDFTYLEKLLMPYYLTQDLHELLALLLGDRVLEKDFLEAKAPDAFMIEKDGQRAVFTDPETIAQTAAMFDEVRVRRAWADGTVKPDGFYVLTWGSKTAAPDMPVFASEQFWYRPSDDIFRKNGYACILGRGYVDTNYLNDLLYGPAIHVPFTLESAASAVLESGDGASVTIEDPGILNTLQGMICVPPYRKVTGSQADYRYKVSWFDADGRMIDEVCIIDRTFTYYHENSYMVEIWPINLDYLDSLLKNPAK